MPRVRSRTHPRRRRRLRVALGPRSLRVPMTGETGRCAIFLDRDGVLNRNVLYADTQAYESPRSASELVLSEGVGPALRALHAAGYLLVLVSNQPNAAKGKCSREVLDQIHARLVKLLAAESVALDAAFYCYHHPAHTGACACRKPSPFFLQQAISEYGLSAQGCWMIGDRETDVACGRAASVGTIWIDTGEGAQSAIAASTDHAVFNLAEAVERILALPG